MALRRYFDQALLDQYRPQLRYDAQEPYRAIRAESITDYVDNKLNLADGTVLAGPGGKEQLTIGLLSAYPEPFEANESDRLDQSSDPIAAAVELQSKEAYANTCYGSIAEDGEWTWLQYWFWLYYNPKHLLGFGSHEGDWEMVQIGLEKSGDPSVVTFAQHDHGERKQFAEIEAEGGVRPVVYVAPFSHASYFEPGTHFYPVGTDNPDGAVIEDPKVESFGDWFDWIGRWGNSRGVLWRLSSKLGGRSPASPGNQGDKWSDPAKFHRDAKLRPPKEERTSWRLGKLTYPRDPELKEVRVEDQEAVIDYELTGNLIQRPSQLLVTVHDAARPGAPIVVSQARRVRRRRGQVRIALPRMPAKPVVRVSAFNSLRQRSDVVSMQGA